MSLLTSRLHPPSRMRSLSSPLSCVTPSSLLIRSYRLDSFHPRLSLARSLTTTFSFAARIATHELPTLRMGLNSTPPPPIAIAEPEADTQSSIPRNPRSIKRAERRARNAQAQQHLTMAEGASTSTSANLDDGVFKSDPQLKRAESNSEYYRASKPPARKIKKMRHRVMRRLQREAADVDEENGGVNLFDVRGDGTGFETEEHGMRDFQQAAGMNNGNTFLLDSWRPTDRRPAMLDSWRPTDRRPAVTSFWAGQPRPGTGTVEQRKGYAMSALREDTGTLKRPEDSGMEKSDNRYPHIIRPEDRPQAVQQGKDEPSPLNSKFSNNYLRFQADNPNKIPRRELKKLKGARLRAALEPPHEIRTPPPVPTESYLSIAKQQPRRLEKPNRLLVVLDLNGTLMYRPKHTVAGPEINWGGMTDERGSWNKTIPPGIKQSTRPIMRPDLPEFLTYLFNNFEVMVWTSAQAPNALRMVRAAFTPGWIEKLRAVWSRDTLGLSNADFYSRVQVYKRLERIWTGRYKVDARTAEEIRNNIPTTTHFWDQSNTILIDDSILKASAQPHNLIEVPSMVALDEIEKDDKVLNHVMAYLEELKYYDNVSAYMREISFSAWMKQIKKEQSKMKLMEKELQAISQDPGLDRDMWEPVEIAYDVPPPEPPKYSKNNEKKPANSTKGPSNVPSKGGANKGPNRPWERRGKRNQF